jgi:hypothetical protein
MVIFLMWFGGGSGDDSAAVGGEPPDFGVGDQPASAEPYRSDLAGVDQSLEVAGGHGQERGRVRDRPRGAVGTGRKNWQIGG